MLNDLFGFTLGVFVTGWLVALWPAAARRAQSIGTGAFLLYTGMASFFMFGLWAPVLLALASILLIVLLWWLNGPGTIFCKQKHQ